MRYLTWVLACMLLLPSMLSSQHAYGNLEDLCSGLVVEVRHAESIADGVRIHPGGRVVYVVHGPLSVKDLRLAWESDGPLKIKAIQIGIRESIQLSEIIVWDNADQERKSIKRACGLTDFVTRFQYQRRQNHAHITANNLFFLTVESQCPEVVEFRGLRLMGRRMKHEVSGVFDDLRVKKVVDGSDIALGWGESRHEVVLGRKYLVHDAGLGFASLSIGEQVGAFHVLHSLARGESASDDHVGTLLIEYEDGVFDAICAVKSWNIQVEDGGGTWWGPATTLLGQAVYLPKGEYGDHWTAKYQMSYLNPRPNVPVKRIILSKKDDNYKVEGIMLERPESTLVGLVEPDRATFEAGEKLGFTMYEYRAKANPGPPSVASVELVKPDLRVELGKLGFHREGHYSSARGEVTIPDDWRLCGPVRLKLSSGIASSELGLLYPRDWRPRPNYMSMIGGGRDPRQDYVHLKRLGYDAFKLHLPWIVKENGDVDWNGWEDRFKTITDAGLKISFRNHITNRVFPHLEQCARRVTYEKDKEPEIAKSYDPADETFRKKLVEYYVSSAKLGATRPDHIISINANYGLRQGIGTGRLTVGPATFQAFLKSLQKEFTLEEFNRATSLNLGSFSELQPDHVLNDRSRVLLPRLSRVNHQLLASLQREVVREIRRVNPGIHLTFNAPFHVNEHTMLGLTTEEYLRLATEYGPGSIFHETADRYCLSFAKWMLAKRTFGHLYGDEGCQNPPTYEHNTFAYCWMTAFQCWDALYCQWWGGKPAHQNIARLKPDFQLVFNAEYIPDPICLAISLNAAFEQLPDMFGKPLHSQNWSHYSLANLLRGTNLNADRYMVEEFPEQDRNVKSKLLIDDSTRSISQKFGDRLVDFMEKGGVFLGSLATDSLNQYRFYGRFGIGIKGQEVEGLDLIRHGGAFPVVEKRVGMGKLVVLTKWWSNPGWMPGATEELRRDFAGLLRRYGEFEPNVSCDAVPLSVIPYRAVNGDLVLYVVNPTVRALDACFDVKASLIRHNGIVRDMWSGRELEVERRGNRVLTRTQIQPMGAATILFRSR
jgi:hypothetical protein